MGAAAVTMVGGLVQVVPSLGAEIVAGVELGYGTYAA